MIYLCIDRPPSHCPSTRRLPMPNVPWASRTDARCVRVCGGCEVNRGARAADDGLPSEADIFKS